MKGRLSPLTRSAPGRAGVEIVTVREQDLIGRDQPAEGEGMVEAAQRAILGAAVTPALSPRRFPNSPCPRPRIAIAMRACLLPRSILAPIIAVC